MKEFKSTFLRTITAVMLLIFVIPTPSLAQSSTEKNKVFEFFLNHKIDQEGAKKLDATMMERKGILSCKTDAATGKVTVKVISLIDFAALRNVVNYAGFECNEENMVIREE